MKDTQSQTTTEHLTREEKKKTIRRKIINDIFEEIEAKKMTIQHSNDIFTHK